MVKSFSADSYGDNSGPDFYKMEADPILDTILEYIRGELSGLNARVYYDYQQGCVQATFVPATSYHYVKTSDLNRKFDQEIVYGVGDEGLEEFEIYGSPSELLSFLNPNHTLLSSLKDEDVSLDRLKTYLAKMFRTTLFDLDEEKGGAGICFICQTPDAFKRVSATIQSITEGKIGTNINENIISVSVDACIGEFSDALQDYVRSQQNTTGPTL